MTPVMVSSGRHTEGDEPVVATAGEAVGCEVAVPDISGLRYSRIGVSSSSACMSSWSLVTIPAGARTRVQSRIYSYEDHQVQRDALVKISAALDANGRPAS
jgi:hypothetical protein